MRRSLAKFSESETSNHTPSWADFITATPELEFSVHTGLDRPSAARRLARSAGKVMEAIGLHRSRTRSVGVCWRADRDEPKVSLNVRPNHSGRRERSRALGLLTGLGKPPRSECHGRARLTQPPNLPLCPRYRHYSSDQLDVVPCGNVRA